MLGQDAYGTERDPTDIWVGPYNSVVYHATRLGFSNPWIANLPHHFDAVPPTVRLHICSGLHHKVYDPRTDASIGDVKAIGRQALQLLAQGPKRIGLRGMANPSAEPNDG